MECDIHPQTYITHTYTHSHTHTLSQGKEGESVEVDLTREPNEVDCIIEALKHDRKPVLYLFRE